LEDDEDSDSKNDGYIKQFKNKDEEIIAKSLNS